MTPSPCCPCTTPPRIRWWQALPALHAGGKIIAACISWATEHFHPPLL